MKKLFILLAILSINLPVCGEDYNTAEPLKPLKLIQKSYEKQNKICADLAKNFHYDSNFSAYMKNLCSVYTFDRQRTLNILYPMTQQNGKDYSDNYQTYMAEYAVNMDNEQINHYRKLINEYCKYNSYKFVKKDPEACKRVPGIFSN